MIDIFEIPVYYISFNPKKKLEKHIKAKGFKNITHFQAIDGRKYNPIQLAKDNTISPRSYYDLTNGRNQHSGISSLGVIGCSLSHSALWKICIDKNFPFVCIMEDDVVIKSLNDSVIKRIQNSLSKPKSVFVGSKISKNESIMFIGLQFYIISKEACIESLKDFLPIDVQVDFYLSYLDIIGKINLEGFSMSKENGRPSTIQDICVKCILPKTILPYILFIIGVFLIIIFFVRWFSYK